MATSWSAATSFHSPNPSQPCAAPSIASLTIGAGWRRFSIARNRRLSVRLPGASVLGQGTRQEALLRRRFAQLGIGVKLRRDPFTQPFRLEHGAVDRVVVAHPEQRFGKLLLQRGVQIGPGREHAVIEGWRGPDLGERTFGYQVFGTHGIPERAADCAGIGAAVEHRANDLRLARAGVTVLAEVGVEAQRLVVSSLFQSLALQEMNWKDRRVAAVAAAKGQGAALKIGKLGDRPAGYRNDLGHPAHISIAHRDRSATVVAPGIGLDKSEVRIPSDVDVWQGLARRSQQGGDLRLVALKQHDLDRDMRFLVKVASHAPPDPDPLRIICDGTYPDRPAHDCFSPSKQRYSQDGLADEFAQDISRRRHDSACMGVTE